MAMEYERNHGRDPVDVSKTGVGYDVRSEGAGSEVRYIEVKGHASTGGVTLYYTEWQMAHRMGAEFFIYDVYHALTNPQLRIVQDPVGKGLSLSSGLWSTLSTRSNCRPLGSPLNGSPTHE